MSYFGKTLSKRFGLYTLYGSFVYSRYSFILGANISLDLYGMGLDFTVDFLPISVSLGVFKNNASII